MTRYALAGNGGTPSPVLKPLSPLVTRPIRIGRLACIVGSHSRVHLPLHSAMVSRTHALIVVDGTDAFVRDLASRNGVYVNGILMREGKLRHGDLLCVGPFAFWWRVGPLPGPRPRHLSAYFDNAATLTINGETKPRRMEGRSLVLGRREECDIVLNSALIESSHAVLYRQGGKFHLRDLNSKTGTFVNSRRVRKAELRSGDEIRIGLNRIEFEAPQGPPVGVEGAGVGRIDELPGLVSLEHADQPVRGSNSVAQLCPTIEQLLGVSTGQNTKWEWGRF